MKNIDKLSYAEIQEIVNKQKDQNFPTLRLAVLRNITIEPVQPYLQYLALNMDFHAEIKFSQYDNIFQEAIGESNLVTQDTDCILVFVRLEALSFDLSWRFSKLKTDEIRKEKERIKEFITNILEGIRSKTDKMILWHSFVMPLYPSYGILDSQKNNMQIATIRELNETLSDCLKAYPDAYYVDLNLCLARLGEKQFYDYRYWHINRLPYTREALKEIAKEDFKFIRASKGKNKKCLVLDCDGILWGGIVGEDGLNGIKLGKVYPGSSFYEFQMELLNLHNRGIILALCSKNNEDDVWEVFSNHPDMVLRKEHISAFKINWQDKATNIQQIAKNLNIGLDSLVFIDNSEFEVNLVKDLLPEVETIHMPSGKAPEFRNILSSDGFFDTLSISEEDKKRGEMYRAEFKRKLLKTKTVNIENYLRSLEMEIFVKKADAFHIPRVAQLTQKTNQFNLTTKRYSEGDIKRFSEQPECDVLFLNLKDRFGDYGIVGVAILKHFSTHSEIDTFLLSCRILGRGVENVFLNECLQLSRRKTSKILSYYIKTKKNNLAENFYQKCGFNQVEQNNDQKVYSLNANQTCITPHQYFKSISINI